MPAVSADVHAGLTAQVQRVCVKQGDRVAAGDTLAMLDDGTLRLSETAVRVAYEKVKSRLKRAEQMQARGLISAQQLEDLRQPVSIDRCARGIHPRVHALHVPFEVHGSGHRLLEQPHTQCAAHPAY